MAKMLYEESSIQDIADAIREKNGTDTKYDVSEMGQAIREIAGSGSSGMSITFSPTVVRALSSVKRNVELTYDNSYAGTQTFECVLKVALPEATE